MMLGFFCYCDTNCFFIEKVFIFNKNLYICDVHIEKHEKK